MKKLSTREKVLLVVTLLCVVLFFYWQFLLNPLLKEVARTKVTISGLHLKLDQLTATGTLIPDAAELVKKTDIQIYPKEEQLNRVIKFVDEKFRWYGIKMLSLRQSTEDNKLTINLKFKSSSYQFLGFLNSLSQLKTVLVIDNVNVSQEEDKIIAEMKLLSAYK